MGVCERERELELERERERERESERERERAHERDRFPASYLIVANRVVTLATGHILYDASYIDTTQAGALFFVSYLILAQHILPAGKRHTNLRKETY